MKSGKVLLGVLAGVAAGVLIGVLFAPDKGTVTRKKISGKAEALADEMKEKFNEFVESMKEKFNAANEDVGDAEAEAGK
jgi:gas vesicle protein